MVLVSLVLYIPLWNVPEADVGALRLREEQVELLRHLSHPLHLYSHTSFHGHMLTESRAPHEEKTHRMGFLSLFSRSNAEKMELFKKNIVLFLYCIFLLLEEITMANTMYIYYKLETG